MDQNYTPQMPMVTPTPPPAQEPMNGTLGGDLLQQPTRPAPKKGNKAILFISLAIFVALVIVGVIIVVSMSVNKSSETGKFSEIADGLIKKIEAIENHPTIYLYEDLKELDKDFGKSPYDEEIKDSAYIYYLNGESNVCLSDGKHLLTGADNKYDLADTYNDCEFKLTDEIAIEYVENYYKSKGAKITGKTIKTNGNYVVTTEDTTYYAKLSAKDGKIEFSDIKEGISSTGKIETVEDGIRAITTYTTDVLQMNIGNGHDIVEIQKRTTESGNDYILIQVGLAYAHALQYSEQISDFLVSQKSADMLVGVHAIQWKDDKFSNAFVIRITIKDGKGLVETVSRDETAED